MDATARRIFWRVAFVVALAWTIWGSLVPVNRLPPLHLWDKLEHAAIYAALTLLLLRTQWASRPGVVVAALFTFGVLIELAQSRTGYRTADWHDALANLVGILAALAAHGLTRRLRGVPRG